MGVERKNRDWDEEAKRLEEKYQNILTRLCLIPPTERYCWLCARPEWEEFQTDMFEFCSVYIPDAQYLGKNAGRALPQNYGYSIFINGKPIKAGWMEGVAALYDAAKTYDSKKGTFAKWMHGKMWNIMKKAWEKEEDPIIWAAREAKIKEEKSRLGIEDGELTEEQKEKLFDG